MANLAPLAQHIAGIPVEELAIALIATTAPAIAYLGLNTGRYLRLLRKAVTGLASMRTRRSDPAKAPGPPQGRLPPH